MDNLFDNSKDSLIHTGYYTDEAVKCFQQILYVLNPLYIRRTDISFYNDRRIIRAPDGEICFLLDKFSLHDEVYYYYHCMFKKFKDQVFQSGDENEAELGNTLKMCIAEIRNQRMKKLVGEPFSDPFKISVLEVLYAECVKVLAESNYYEGLKRTQELMNQIREIFRS